MRARVLFVAGALALAGCAGTTSAPSATSASSPATTAPPGTTSGSALSGTALYDATCAGTVKVTDAGTVADRLTELSGIVASRSNRGVLWVHNDSGNDPFVFAISEDGKLLGTFRPKDAVNTDWEDIASDGRLLFLADIGDNAKARPYVGVIRIQEPKVTTGGTAEPRPDQPRTVDVEDTMVLVYPDGAHDAEAFFIDPKSGEAFIITKEAQGPAGIYSVPTNGATSGKTITMEKRGSMDLQPYGLPNLVTAADVSPSGDIIAVRTYGAVRLYKRGPGQSIADALAGTPCTGPLPQEKQGEAIAFAADGKSYFTAAEGKDAVLHQTQ